MWLGPVGKLALAGVVLHGSAVSAVWPLPKSFTKGTTALKLSPSFTIQVNVASPPADLTAAVSRTSGYIANDKLERLVPGRGRDDASKLGSAPTLGRLTLSLVSGKPVTSISSESVMDFPSRLQAEGYILNVPATGADATLTANTTLGLLRGLTTFEQLWYVYNGTTYTLQAPISITDTPAFAYRGFMLDTARNYFPVADIKRTLDAMSWVKLNTFHWHVVDSQSFPLVVQGHESLSTNGAYSPSKIYSLADVQDVVSYASARGIDIIMEIDSPGHTSVIAKTHPEFMACVESTPWSSFAAEPPSGQLRLANDNAIAFAVSLFKSAASKMSSKYFSTGGDEVQKNCYDKDASTQADLKAKNLTLYGALSVLTQKTHAALASVGKTAVVWQDMVLTYGVTGMSKSTVILVWKTSANARAVVDKGYPIVHAPSDYLYLDCGAGGWIGGSVGNSWCDPFKTWQKIYSFNPYNNITTAQRPLVYGGETLLWTEQSGPENLDSIIWPRSAASAEVFWTGANQPNGQPRNSTEALGRLHDIRYRMVQRGVRAIALQPEYCALQPQKCGS